MTSCFFGTDDCSHRPNELAKVLREIDSDRNRATELQGQLDAMRAAEYQRENLAEFNKAAAELQEELPSWIPPDYAAAKMDALAHNPEIQMYTAAANG